MSTLNLWEQLVKELAQGKNEKPALGNDLVNKENKDEQRILDEISGSSPSPLMFHNSHNSHGDWGKHWAHGGYTEDEPTDRTDPPKKPLLG